MLLSTAKGLLNIKWLVARQHWDTGGGGQLQTYTCMPLKSMRSVCSEITLDFIHWNKVKWNATCQVTDTVPFCHSEACTPHLHVLIVRNWFCFQYFTESGIIWQGLKKGEALEIPPPIHWWIPFINQQTALDTTLCGVFVFFLISFLLLLNKTTGLMFC